MGAPRTTTTTTTTSDHVICSCTQSHTESSPFRNDYLGNKGWQAENEVGRGWGHGTGDERM